MSESQALMIDNWTLQDVEAILSQGVGQDDHAEIVISHEEKTHYIRPVAEGIVRLDALLTLLNNVVLFDSLVVDRQFVETWKANGGALSVLEQESLVVANDFTQLGSGLTDIREAIVEELCVTPSLEKAMAHVKEEWARKGEYEDGGFLSAVIWGGAGMLARSHLTSVPYFGHPSRRRLLGESRMYAGKLTAVEEVFHLLSEERARMLRVRSRSFSGSVGHYLLPPVALEVIQEASSLEDLLPTAVSLRSRYVHLREWLREYQAALDEEDQSRQLRHEKTLRKVARAVRQQYGDKEEGAVQISLSVGVVSVSFPLPDFDSIRNRFGVRSTLSNLILSPTGERAVSKLLRLLGEDKSLLGRQIALGLKERCGLDA